MLNGLRMLVVGSVALYVAIQGLNRLWNWWEGRRKKGGDRD